MPDGEEPHLGLIRSRAYELFEARGCAPGHALDDWVRAEREVGRTQDSKAVVQGELKEVTRRYERIIREVNGPAVSMDQGMDDVMMQILMSRVLDEAPRSYLI
jgi:hypothetical protein